MCRWRAAPAWPTTTRPASERLTVYTATQTPHLDRTGLARFLGIPEHRIRVIAPDVGGGFGRWRVYPEEVAQPLLARRLHRPVKWVEDRREDLPTSVHAREQMHRVSAAVRNDGSVLGIRARILADNGAYSGWPCRPR